MPRAPSAIAAVKAGMRRSMRKAAAASHDETFLLKADAAGVDRWKGIILFCVKSNNHRRSKSSLRILQPRAASRLEWRRGHSLLGLLRAPTPICEIQSVDVSILCQRFQQFGQRRRSISLANLHLRIQTRPSSLIVPRMWATLAAQEGNADDKHAAVEQLEIHAPRGRLLKLLLRIPATDRKC
jgi:hypothetical protein